MRPSLFRILVAIGVLLTLGSALDAAGQALNDRPLGTKGSTEPAPRKMPRAGTEQMQPGPAAPSPAQPQARQTCAPPLRQGCEAQQASCRMVCPPTWSTNPGAPAFTPNDRAGCTQQCLTRYFACLNLYGCSR